MSQRLTCPYCSGEISLEDVNVSRDIALCRRCGRNSSYALISGHEKLRATLLHSPPKHLRLIPETLRGEKKIIFRKVSPLLFFFVPFTLVWAGGSLTGLYGTQLWEGEFDPARSLFGLPFLLGSIVLVAVTAFLAFGQWVVTFGNGRGSVFLGIGNAGWTRSFTYDRQTVVKMQPTDVKINDVPQMGVSVKTGKKEIVFGTTLPEDAKRFIAAALMQEIAAWR